MPPWGRARPEPPHEIKRRRPGLGSPFAFTHAVQEEALLGITEQTVAGLA
jgi:hypothetical protein